ncbi:MAG: hypothetical protein KF829_10290 [Ferruginibacter sp.]|nr:hypothetical protein [Ferruginibacter sp.]
MKKIFFLTALFYSFSICTKAQSNLESLLTNINLNQYLDKPIDTLLAHIPYTDSISVHGSEPVTRGAMLVVVYDSIPYMWLDIKIYEPQFINPNSFNWYQPEIAWPLSLLRKEKIWQITVYKADLNKVSVINFAELQ